MTINLAELRALPPEEKLRIVEMLWDDLGDSTMPIPLPDWVIQEANRRREELMHNPALALSHEEVWRRIDGRND
jgi:putative addiction module component (TIGR02574 family)